MSAFIDELPPDLEEMPPDIESFEDENIQDNTTTVKVESAKGASTTNNDGAEEKTLMEEMMAISKAEKEKRIAKRDKLRKKQDKSFGSGLQGGFFNQQKTKKKKKKKKGIQAGFLNSGGDGNTTKKSAAKKKKKKDEEDDVDYVIEDDIIRPKMKKNQDIRSSLRIEEVQAAMKTTVDNQSQWMTPDFMQRVASNPKLAMAMANPRCMQAMQDFQTDPAKASEKYKNDEVVNSFMQEFLGLMGDHMQKLGQKEKSNKEINERARKEEAMKKIKSEDPEVAKVLSNPEVFNLLNDPEMKKILQECSTTPYALNKYMNDPKIRKKLEMMKKFGLVNF